MANTCDGLVVSCIDFRFVKYIRDWTDKQLAGKTYDRVAFAGSTKDLDAIMKQVDVSVKLHHIKKVILIHHEECGAYGEAGTRDRHELDLKKAKKTILAKYPNLTVELYYLHLVGQFDKVE